ncbi:MAG TPA: murein biosynthesis integral membrane protein MurJ [Patescibacteria group bacterium]|nr:murein biosynthesis integral membrane protein MurJ [Patescibacteria group bacterium]
MTSAFLKKSLSLFTRQQTNILSAALIIMATVIFSQLLGLVRQRLLVTVFGASNTLGVYLASGRLPDFLFQIIIAGALSSAFIPVFSDYLVKGKEKEGYAFASTLLTLGLAIFFIISLVLFVFAPFFSGLVAPGFSSKELILMGNLMRVTLAGEMLFIIASFFSALLQSYNHFLIPGLAAALYNLGIIIGILFLAPSVGIFAPAYGVIIGALLFVIAQIPMVKKVGFRFHIVKVVENKGLAEVFHLMWPRTLSIAIFQLGTLLTVTLISLLHDAGRNYVIFDYAQTLAFAPVGLFGQTIAQAAFPVLSRQKHDLVLFRQTFLSSFFQMLYLVLPVSVLFIVLRIPLVRLIYGASQFDWQATVFTGHTLALFAFSLFAQSLIYLVSRGFYALHDTITPLVIGAFSTAVMLLLGVCFIFFFHLSIGSIAFAYSISSIINFLVLFVMLDRKTGGFTKKTLFFSSAKIFLITFFTAFALYIPIKLLDQLVFDTTKTVELLMLTGISSLCGLLLYLLLTWVFNVQEAKPFLLLFKRVGNWREILYSSEEAIEPPHTGG